MNEMKNDMNIKLFYLKAEFRKLAFFTMIFTMDAGLFLGWAQEFLESYKAQTLWFLYN